MLDLFNIICAGQCGCRIGKEFAKLGFTVCYINSDVIDMRAFGAPEDKVLLLDTTGSGRSPIKGRAILENNFHAFAEFMDKNLQPGVMNLFIIGLGGGTGGGMALPAIEYTVKKGMKAGLLATLPARMAGMLDMNNALHSLRELKEAPLSMFILADNDYLINNVGLSTEWWQKINYFILKKMAVIFDLLRENKTSQAGVGSIDKGELMRILQYGQGLLDVRDIYLNIPGDVALTDEELKQRLSEPGLISGYKYSDTLFYLVNVDIPKQGGFTELAARVFSICRAGFGISLSRVGMFIDPSLDKAIRVTIITAGLKLPKVLRSRINNLKRDSDRHSDKKTKEDLLDFSSVDDINIDEDFEL
jgi:cell division GTPase FtsZ